MDEAVAVAVDAEALPLRLVEAERPRLLELRVAHAAPVVGLEAGDGGQRPDALLAELVAAGSSLEGLQVLGRDLLVALDLARAVEDRELRHGGGGSHEAAVAAGVGEDLGDVPVCVGVGE